MRNERTIALGAAAAVITSAAVFSIAVAGQPVAPRSWNPRAAAAYLDQRQGWWESWPKAARDRGTVCLSCHTAVPYALARPELRAVLHENDVAPPERKLVSDVTDRVRAWNEVKPFYGDTTEAGRVKAIQSRGTEAVLNALVLASRDQRAGVMSADAGHAFANMFALQQNDGDQAGAWPWLDFGLRPWESTSAVYFGAALAAIAVGSAPQSYAQSVGVQPNIARLRTYLRTHIDQPIWNRIRRRDNPDLFNRAMLLWSSSNLRGLLSTEERESIIAALWKAQAPDGAWRLASLGHWRHADGVTVDSTGDGYATGLIAYALEEAGSAPSEPHLARALAWLAPHQDAATGMWSASSLNKQRDPKTNIGKFMSDAATAYAVLALARAPH